MSDLPAGEKSSARWGMRMACSERGTCTYGASSSGESRTGSRPMEIDTGRRWASSVRYVVVVADPVPIRVEVVWVVCPLSRYL